MTIKNYDDPVEIAADDAEDFLGTLIDNLRAKIAARTPGTVESLTDEIMDYFEALPMVQRDPTGCPSWWRSSPRSPSSAWPIARKGLPLPTTRLASSSQLPRRRAGVGVASQSPHWPPAWN